MSTEKNGYSGAWSCEVRCQADAGDGVHQVAEVDALVGADAGQLADGFALGPFGHGLGAALIGDLEGVGHVSFAATGPGLAGNWMAFDS